MTGRESTMKSGILNKAWEQTQIKVFSRWCAKYLKERDIPFTTIGEGSNEFEDGVKLINLLEIIGKEPMKKKWHRKCINRFQKLENVEVALDYITNVKKIKLESIHNEQIVDNNVKMILGLIWSCISKFSIEDISVEEKTARDALLIWCKKNTQGYEDVNVTNFSTSWSSGLAFCALINHFRPEYLDYTALDRADHTNNCVQAFDACRKLGITVFLDPEDLVNTTPDDKSVVTQVSEFFHFFAGESKIMQSADKIKNTIAIQRLLEQLTSDYEKQAQATIDAINEEKEKILNTDYEKTVPGVKAKLIEVVGFGRVGRPRIVELRTTALNTWASLVANCKTHSRTIPTPKAGLEPEALNAAFDDIEQTQQETRVNLARELHDLENAMIKEFDDKCNAITSQCADIKERAGATLSEGSLYDQRDALQNLLSEAQGLTSEADALQGPYDEINSNNLSQRTKNTIYSVRNTVDQRINHLNRLIDQNNSAIIEAEKKAKIDAYNEKAQTYLDEINTLEQSFSEIQGSIDERRNAWIAKQDEIKEKRDGVKNIVPDFEQLESEGLHLSIVNTPDTLEGAYSKLLTTALLENQKVFDEMVVEFDQLTEGLEQRIKDIHSQAENLSGPLSDQRDTISNLTEQAKEIQNDIPGTLNEPFELICQFNLQWNVKMSPTDVNGSVEQLLTYLSRLNEQNKAALLKENNNNEIQKYNELASQYRQEANKFGESIKEIDGDISAKLQAYIEKTHELAQKRDAASQALIEPYKVLEKAGLHLEIVDTPSSISSQYASILSEIGNAQNAIYDEMVSNYDNLASQTVDVVQLLEQQVGNLESIDDLENRKSSIEDLIGQVQPIEVDSLNSPFDELTQYKLNYRAKYSPNEIKSMIDQLMAQLHHLQLSTEGSMTHNSNQQQVEGYNGKAKALIDNVKALESELSSIEGTNESKLEQLGEKENEIKSKESEVDELTRLYEELEAKQLHLEIEDTPTAVTTFINGAVNRAETMIQEIHKAIAAEKGLEISAEQLSEFQESFNQFDKDKNKALAPYELVACLTTLGDAITEKDATEIINKFNPGQKELGFEGYVNFMLERYSKKETPENTKEAFLAISQNSPVITEEQMSKYFSPEDVEYLKSNMNQVEGGYDFAGYVDSLFS